MRQMLRSAFAAFFLVAILGLSAPAQARGTPESFADLAEKLLPSVVNISTTQTVAVSQDLPEFDLQIPEDSPFNQFFEEFKKQQNKNGRGGKKRSNKATSLGSGFIIDPAGYIVTNNHVIQDAEEITVILHDDTNLMATVVGRDKKTDLAVLKVQTKKPLTAVTFGDSDKIRVGDWILAIGNPYGLGGTVTTGIISARARDINSGPYDDYLQTDAPINRGNSGGPMFNMSGEVIGINTAIYSPTGGSVGIGFAIPSAMAKNIIDQLKATGTTKRGWLGVRIQAVTQEIADSLELGKARGALVSSITPDGPADKAKLQSGDVIVSFDGKDVIDMHRLPRLVADTEVGKTVDMKIIRKGKEITAQVKVGELDQNEADEEEETASDEVQKQTSERVSELGMGVLPLSDSLRKKYDIAKNVTGVVVITVDDDGKAADYGIRAGDVISEAAQQEVKTAKSINDLARTAKKEAKPLLLLVDRKGDLRFVAVSFDKPKKK
ncbi:MAG: DegQ family serine endoprotease [Alphaproteobacteria bacterium]|nr:DegQ family serine endoprotease [Alphaproteobacteria bacterium]